MALFFDPPTVAFSGNQLALGFITNFEGSYSHESQNIGGFDVVKVTYHKSSNSFGANRLEAITNTLSENIFLSEHGPEFPLDGGLKLSDVGAAVLQDPNGQVLVWDTSYCNGNGYHVFDVAGNPIMQEMYLTVFHELSHAYHNVIGTNLPDLASMEALAIHETNLLRSELGIAELRDPQNHEGGCGPGRKKPWWEKPLIEFVESVGAFLDQAQSQQRNGLSPKRIAELVGDELNKTAQFWNAGSASRSALRENIERPCFDTIAAFYRCAGLALDPNESHAELLSQLVLELARLPKERSSRSFPLGSTNGNSTAVSYFFFEPYRIMAEIFDAESKPTLTAEPLSVAFERSVQEWFGRAMDCSADMPEDKPKMGLMASALQGGSTGKK